MANLRASKKDIRKIATRTERSKHFRSRLKTLSKKVAVLAAQGANTEGLKDAALAYVSAMDKAAKQGIVHHNKAARHKASVSKYIFA